MSSLTPRLDKLDKNYIINGNFDYWQRNTTGNITGAVVAVDRFLTNYNSGAAGTVSRSTDIPDTNSTYSAQVNVTTGQSALIGQRIESTYSKDLIGKTVTFKIKVKAVDATGQPFRLLISTPNVTDNYTGITSFSDTLLQASPVAGQWYTLSTTISIPADAVRGLQVAVSRGTVSATTSSRYSQMQLVIGDNINPDFNYAARNVVEELNLCQRYFEKSYDVDTIVGTPTVRGRFSVHSVSSNRPYLYIPFKVPKRNTPTIVIYNVATGAAGSMRNEAGTDSNAGIDGVNIGSNGFDVYQSSNFNTQGAYGHYTADAELI
jgi:hypothetical protein